MIAWLFMRNRCKENPDHLIACVLVCLPASVVIAMTSFSLLSNHLAQNLIVFIRLWIQILIALKDTSSLFILVEGTQIFLLFLVLARSSPCILNRVSFLWDMHIRWLPARDRTIEAWSLIALLEPFSEGLCAVVEQTVSHALHVFPLLLHVETCLWILASLLQCWTLVTSLIVKSIVLDGRVKVAIIWVAWLVFCCLRVRWLIVFWVFILLLVFTAATTAFRITRSFTIRSVPKWAEKFDFLMSDEPKDEWTYLSQHRDVCGQNEQYHIVDS